MKKLQPFCATLALVLALGATTYAEDGIMGTGAPAPHAVADNSADEPATTTPGQPSADTDTIDLITATELDIWQNIVTLL